MTRTRFVVLTLFTSLAAVGSASSCASEDDFGGSAPEDGDAEAPMRDDDGSSSDALDAARARDAERFDSGPHPIVCTSSPCAVSLVTTLGADNTDRSEGFCALLDDGTVACWGANASGQLGRGDDAGTGDSATAARVTALSDVVQLDHTCALDKSGQVWCWGKGPFLRNDAGATSTERSPVRLPLPRAKSVGVGVEVGCAVVDDGVLCWGRNSSAQVAPPGPGLPLPIQRLPPRWIDVPPGPPIRDVVVGKATFVRREDGVTMSWGANSLLARVSSLTPDPQPRPMVLGGISSLDVTSDTACATVAGIGYCWGRAIASPPFDRMMPEPVVAPELIVQISTTRAMQTTELGGPITQPQRWCAVGLSGAVYCWGYNAGGQAGDGTKEHAIETVKVQGLPERAAEVKTMPDSTCALLTNGTVYCWGANYYGQLGNGTMRMPSLTPHEVVLPPN